MLRRFVLALALVAACGERSSEKPAPAPAAPPTPPPTDPAAHSDHSPRHGGVVLMDGDLHFEAVIGADGAHAVHFTDATRKELPATTASRVTVTIDRGDAVEPEVVQLTPDGTAWRGRGRPIAGEATARIEYDAPGKARPYRIDVTVGGNAAASAGARKIREGQRDGDATVELAAEPTGGLRLTLLDADGKPRPTDGVTATVAIGLRGHQPVAMTAAGDHFTGRGKDLDHDHATATVTLVEKGVTTTARVKLHLESPDELVRAYDAVRAALAADDHATASRGAARLEATARAAKLDDVAAAARALVQAPDLAAARKSFGDVSRLVIALVEKEPARAPDHQVFECPMVSGGFGRWLQAGDEARNPYFGGAMLTCGAPP